MTVLFPPPPVNLEHIKHIFAINDELAKV